MNNLLQGRTALITGGTSGIGFEIARSFLNAGANIVITGRRQERIDKALSSLQTEFNAKGLEIHGIVMDVTKVSELEEKFQTICSYAPIDILVNNAGIEGGHINWCKEEDFDKIISTNLKGVFFLSRIVARYMIKEHIQGNILNLCSSSSNRPANSAYTLSKWGVKGFTEGLARMLISHGIVVNGIAPGMTATPMLMPNGVNENIANSKTLTGRYARPEEIANMSVIMVSGMCRMVVGDVLYMTGGSGTLYHEDVNYNFI
jgi:NAD(P)-dependent dehydrogenase (short-subunit alcohol dehydrogenase family)